MSTVDSVHRMAVHYRVHAAELILHSQAVAAATYLRSRFPEGPCDMHEWYNILTSLEVLPVYSLFWSRQTHQSYQCWQIGSERFFSLRRNERRTGAYLRNSMNDLIIWRRCRSNALCALKSFALHDLLDDFAKLRPRRCPLPEWQLLHTIATGL